MKTNLKELRKSAGWSNADDFARSIGMPPKTYRNYEQGVRSLGIDVACELSNALGCTLNDLVGIAQCGGDEAALAHDEERLLTMYRNMDMEHRAMILRTAEAFVGASEKEAQDDRVSRTA